MATYHTAHSMRNPQRPFPMQKTALPLPSGRTVTVLNVIIADQRGKSSGTLGIQYRSSVSARDLEARRAEAFEVTKQYAAFAEERGLSMSAQICNTEAAAETREAPERIFFFELGKDDQWAYRYSVNADGVREA